mmetsp:Transcript_41251/g.78831  ORF Transcript_41251/g.78831 Transcript_41251/m.78831 type:complete len:218 (-) Transcript_41251:43-696(-)
MLVLILHSSDRKSGSSFLVDDGTKTGLALHNAVWHVHLAAESRKPHHQLNRVHIMRNHDQLSLSLLNQVGDMVQAEFRTDGLLGLKCFAFFLSCCLLHETLLLGSLVLRAVLHQQFEQISSRVLIQRFCELVERWGHLQPLSQHTLLALDAYILWPLHKAVQRLFRWQSSTNAKAFRSLLKQWVRLLHRCCLLLRNGRGGGHLLASRLLLLRRHGGC